MPKIVWNKGDDDKRDSLKNKRFRRDENKKRLYNSERGYQSSQRPKDNQNNRVRLQHLEKDPHDDVRGGAMFRNKRKNSTEDNQVPKRLGLGLLAGLTGLIKSNEKENSRKKEVKERNAAPKPKEDSEPETKDRRVIITDEDKTNNGDLVESADKRTGNERQVFETTVETCRSESSASPKVYEDYKKKKRKSSQERGRRKSSKKKKKKKRKLSSSSSSSSSSESDSSTEREEDLKKIRKAKERCILTEDLPRVSPSSSVTSVSPGEMDELLSKVRKKSIQLERKKKPTLITGPDPVPEPARLPVQSRLGPKTDPDREEQLVVNTQDSRRKIEEVHSKARRDSREIRFSKATDSERNSREQVSRTPYSRDSTERISKTPDHRKERRKSDQGSGTRRSSIPDSEREKDKLLNRVRNMRTDSKREKKEAVNSREVEGSPSTVKTQAPSVPRVGWRCEICGETDHLVEQCPHSETNGTNPRDPFGKRDQCHHCLSFNHLSAACPHSKENGSNKVGREGKFQCGWCGSYDHLTHLCQRIHSKKLGRNPTGIGGKKLSCFICNSYHHRAEDHFKVTDSCHHCGSFDHATDHCPEITIRTVKLLPEQPEFQCEFSEEDKVIQKAAEAKMLARLKCKAEGKGSLTNINSSDAASPAAEGEPVQVFDIYTEEDLRTDPARQPEIKKNMHEEIVEALDGKGKYQEGVVKSFKINIETSDLDCLKGDNWLNDNVVEFYMKLIAERSMTESYRRHRYPSVYAMSTYFFQHLIRRGPNALERWTKDVDIFDFDLILVPIHLEEHWCLAVVNFRAPGVFYYDSMGGHNMPALSAILKYLQVEYRKKRNTELDIKKYIKEIVVGSPQQENESDCGIFACKTAEFVSRGASLRFSQEDMPFYRKLMVYEIANKRLLIDQP